ncbi:MAG: mreC [Gammaproteobacteria bacterium]|jgi:rod shape-determining protein MreC|nr:mreC [Gammaproteobacteria bacterium]
MIFHKEHTFGFRFWILLLLSFALLILDNKHILSPRLKTYLQMAATPLQYAIVLPEQTYFSVRDYFTLQHELVHDKKNWQDQKLVLQAKLQELNALKAQNEELKSLLKASAVQQNQKYMMVRIIGLKGEGSEHEVLINAGSDAGISSGQALVAADGIIGQVIQTTPINSRVMLLSDSRSAIPVTNERTRENLIVIGTGNSQDLNLLNPMNNADLKAGDTLISSGIGGHYPPGYPVGKISQIELQGRNIGKVHIIPATNLNRLHLALVVFVNNNGGATA